MKIETCDDTLRVTELRALDAAGADQFESELNAALPSRLRCIEIDLAQTNVLDSSGLGALVAVHEEASRRHGDVIVRVLNAAPPARQLLELTRLHRLFDVAPRSDRGGGVLPRHP